MSFFVSVGVEKTAFYFDDLFIYEVPSALIEKVKLGCLVSVNFGKNDSLRQAIVLKISDSSSVDCKFINQVLSDGAVISFNLLQVVKYLHDTCFCTWFEAVKTVLPSGYFFKLCNSWNFSLDDDVLLTQREHDLVTKLKHILKLGGEQKLNSFLKKNFDGEFKKIFKSLEKKGLIFKKSVFKRTIARKSGEKVVLNHGCNCSFKLTTKQQKLLNYVAENEPVFAKQACYDCRVSVAVLRALERKNLIKFEMDFDGSKFFSKNYLNKKFEFKSIYDINLNFQQQRACEGLIELLRSGKASTALLRGVTGSGKTVVFLKLIDFAFKMGKQVILLVPEIALTPQIVDYFKLFFGEFVSVLHSGLTSKQQLHEHEKIKLNITKLVIGTRSAIFAPCVNLGLVIMDEEGELTYKNKDLSPRYHARDVAKFRCLQHHALLVLASATPSVETQYFAKIGRYKEFVLSKRFKTAILPKVFVVDMKKAEPSPIFGVSLFFYNELLKNLKSREQTIVLLNRRGYNSSVICLNCGFKVSCVNCSAVLTYHNSNDGLICHYCGRIQKAVKICSNCASSKLTYFGQGTQKIEQELALNLNGARVLRLDSDSVYSKTDLESKIKQFEMGYYDVLVGTQIVAKGLNFANVTLVGVLAIDNVLYGSDFRNGEQVFSLLTQVVGRSGRGEKLGRAIIQTYSGQNPIILKAAAQNYENFYYDEIKERRAFLYPPFCDICIVNFSGLNQKKVSACAKEFVLFCKKNARVNVPIKVLGISTPFIEKLNKRFRKRVIIKCKNGAEFRSWIGNLSKQVFSLSMFIGIRANIDISGEIL